MGIALATYHLKIKDLNKNEYIFLDKITNHSHIYNPSQISAFKDSHYCFSQCLGDLEKNGKKHETKSKRIKVKCIDPKLRCISGKVLVGNLGSEQTAMGPDPHDDVTIKPEIAVGPPYYFLMYLPNKSQEGIIILERRDTAIKEIFEFLLNQAFKYLRLGDYSIELNQFVPKRIIKEYVNTGFVNKITYASYEKNDGVEIIQNGHQSTKHDVFLQYKNKEKVGVSKDLRSLLLGERKADKKELKQRGYQYEDMKIELDIGNGHQRTFTISNPENSYPYYDVTKQVEMDTKKGNPVFSSIDGFAKNYLKMVLNN